MVGSLGRTTMHTIGTEWQECHEHGTLIQYEGYPWTTCPVCNDKEEQTALIEDLREQADEDPFAAKVEALVEWVQGWAKDLQSGNMDDQSPKDIGEALAYELAETVF